MHFFARSEAQIGLPVHALAFASFTLQALLQCLTRLTAAPLQDLPG